MAAFLDFLRDRLAPPGQYADPGTSPQRHSGEIPADIVAHAARALESIRWGGAEVREFTGRFLTEPKAQVFFTAPRKPLSRARFARESARHGVALDPRSRLMFSGTMFFLNGEEVEAPAKARAMLSLLADERRLPGPVKAPQEFWDVAHAWYLQGFAHAGEAT